uniref:GDSL esterase/lipase At4g10955-like n=1 Tax=Erigeron canadensis TaxID=72917 RepID=UPI001CB8F147|nr:GDSL esterase/lipase At4g10955-like [Erigeron canadensis]
MSLVIKSNIENQDSSLKNYSDDVISERECFELSGPLHLTPVDWTNVDHRRSVSACLVQGVYIIERDRQENRKQSEALAPPWWNFFQFELHAQLIDDADSCVFGAIYKYKLPPSQGTPSYVIAFRGTLTKGNAFSRDLELDIHIIKNGLHQTSRFEIAMQAVRTLVSSQTFKSDIWLTGHSLGSAMALLAGKQMAKTGIFLDSYLFNPPFLSAPLENIKDPNIKHGIRIASSFLTAGLAVAAKIKNANQQRNMPADSFLALAGWVPCLYVNPMDHICSEYIGYFEHRNKMEEIGAGGIERLATQHSISGVFLNAIGKESHEPLHLLPAASLTINKTPAVDFKDAHGIHQWWRCDQQLETKVYS